MKARMAILFLLVFLAGMSVGLAMSPETAKADCPVSLRCASDCQCYDPCTD